VPRLVVVSGVFHHSGWAPGAIDLDEEETAFFAEYRGAVSPDGPDHFPVVAAKLHRMHEEEPTLTVADRAGYPGPTLVMVGDGDDEIPFGARVGLARRAPAGTAGRRARHGHGMPVDKPDLFVRLVTDFLTEP